MTVSDPFPKDTLGFHRSMAVVFLGEDSPAVAWLDEKIASSPNGPSEGVVVAESQVVYLLMQIHTGKVSLDSTEIPNLVIQEEELP